MSLSTIVLIIVGWISVMVLVEMEVMVKYEVLNAKDTGSDGQ